MDPQQGGLSGPQEGDTALGLGAAGWVYGAAGMTTAEPPRRGGERETTETPVRDWTRDILQAFGDQRSMCFGARVVYLRGPDGVVLRDIREDRE